MVTMVHPNGCVHNVREDLVAKFLAAGWKEQAVPSEQPVEKPKRKRKKVE